MVGLGERIKIAAEQIGGLDQLASQLTDVSRRTLSDWANDKTEPRASALIEIAKVTDVSLLWLVDGGSAIFPKTGMRYEKNLSPGEASPKGNASIVYLPFYPDVHAAAGLGAVPVAEDRDEDIGFDRQILRALDLSENACSVIRASGDSMLPTIPDKSLLVVDHNQAVMRNGHIMVIGLGDDLLVKRVHRRVDGRIDLISDNSLFPIETLEPEAISQLRIIGRVVLFCRTP